MKSWVVSSIAQAIENRNDPSARIAALAWQTLWSSDERRKRALYLFGLENLMWFEEQMLQAFFAPSFSCRDRSGLLFWQTPFLPPKR